MGSDAFKLQENQCSVKNPAEVMGLSERALKENRFSWSKNCFFR